MHDAVSAMSRREVRATLEIQNVSGKMLMSLCGVSVCDVKGAHSLEPRCQQVKAHRSLTNGPLGVTYDLITDCLVMGRAIYVHNKCLPLQSGRASAMPERGMLVPLMVACTTVNKHNVSPQSSHPSVAHSQAPINSPESGGSAAPHAATIRGC